MVKSRPVDAVVVFAGGRSRRLGSDKAKLDWSGVPLLLHVTGRLAPLSDLVIVSARPGQDLPPGSYHRIDDARPGEGPLAGLAAALSHVSKTDPEARVAVSACDYPFTSPDLFRALSKIDRDADVVLPRWRGHLQPLQAIWRAGVADLCQKVLVEDERRVVTVLDQVNTRVVPPNEFEAELDLERCLLNVNEQTDLERARRLYES